MADGRGQARKKYYSRKWTLSKWRRKAGVSESTMKRFINGEDIRLSTMLKLSEALGKSVEDTLKYRDNWVAKNREND